MSNYGSRCDTASRKDGKISNDFSPSMQSCLMVNWINGYAGMTRENAALEIIRLFLAKHGVKEAPKTTRDLLPADWKAGSTVIPIDFESPGGVQFREYIPDIQAYDQTGAEIHWLGFNKDPSPVFRLKADWDAPVDIVSGILSALTNTVVTRNEVLRLAEQSPETYDTVKKAVAPYKAHFNRLLDPVVLRRDPSYNDVAARYKAQIRSLFAEQQDAAMRLRQINIQLNELLAERDKELSSLDSGYQPRHARAPAELARHGITTTKEEEWGTVETGLTAEALEDLDF
ncbi:hypothetical protein V1525DRAFT_388857 [Lipomyces kononenkoae]|uniref:Uncharacterized protein n=1 Tax=Lipomyces kononenkoae TaxID=34357 RepID=A0ACC3T242_LIPKO